MASRTEKLLAAVLALSIVAAVTALWLALSGLRSPPVPPAPSPPPVRNTETKAASVPAFRSDEDIPAQPSTPPDLETRQTGNADHEARDVRQEPRKNPARHAKWFPDWFRALSQRAETDPEGVLAECLGLPPEQQRMALNMLFSKWARRDPAAALKAAEALPENMRRQEYLQQVLMTGARAEPEDTLRRLAAIANLRPDFRSNIVMQAIAVLRRRNPPTAAINELLRTDQLDPALRSRLTGETIGDWICTDRATALGWLRDSNLDDATYDRAILAAVNRLSNTRQEAVAASLFTDFVRAGRMQHMKDPEIYAQTVLTSKILGATWGGKDFPTALAAAFSMPAGSDAQAYVLSNVAFSQSKGEFMPPTDWIAGLPPGFTRTRVIAAIAYGRLLAVQDQPLYLEMKRQLDSDALEPAKIRDIVNASQLSDNDKRTLQSLLE